MQMKNRNQKILYDEYDRPYVDVPRINSDWAQQLFAKYNRKYWQGTLPHYQILATNCFLTNELGNGDRRLVGRCDIQTRTIFLHPELSRRLARQVLIHEMAHAATPTCWFHEAEWIKEMVRLEKLGAPVSRSEEIDYCISEGAHCGDVVTLLEEITELWNPQTPTSA
jgi:hypothetical protein